MVGVRCRGGDFVTVRLRGTRHVGLVCAYNPAMQSDQLMFSRDAFAVVANKRRDDIRAEVRSQSSRNGSNNSWGRVRDAETIVKGYREAIPLLGDSRARVLADEVAYRIPLVGANGTLFRYIPAKVPVATQPVGSVYSDCVILHVSNSGDTERIKAEFSSKYQELIVWYDAVVAEVSAFNESLPSYVAGLFVELQEDERKAQALEDELNG